MTCHLGSDQRARYRNFHLYLEALHHSIYSAEQLLDDLSDLDTASLSDLYLSRYLYRVLLNLNKGDVWKVIRMDLKKRGTAFR
jgi:hypothetical protein